jgi:hypothetical protein
MNTTVVLVNVHGNATVTSFIFENCIALKNSNFPQTQWGEKKANLAPICQ